MGRMYTVSFAGVAVTAAVDLFEILPAANKPCYVHGLFLGQTSDVGDAAEEILRFSIVRGNTTSGSGGAAATPRPMDSNSVAAGFTAETNNTTAASAGTAVTLHSDTFNVRSGYGIWWTPEARPRVNNANLLVVRLGAAPADSLTMSGTLYVEEA